MLHLHRKELITVRMKDVCERTGLTDRAVRLYIDSDLLSPEEEISYTGRKSIQFSEKDVETLEIIATLRKADFSISDIREMQRSPENIQRILDAHKLTLAEEIESKSRILKTLEKADGTVSSDYKKVAELLRRSASRIYIPKEDSAMRFKDLEDSVKRRIPALIAFAILLVGLVLFIPVVIKTAFAEVESLKGGGLDYHYFVTAERIFSNLQLLSSVILIIAAAILFFIHIVNGKSKLMLAGGIVCAAAILLMLLLPSEIKLTLFKFEFYAYRFSFMHDIFYYPDEAFDIYLKSLKFIPPAVATVLSLIGFCRQKNMSAENIK